MTIGLSNSKKQGKRRAWPPKRRAAQAARIKTQKPWEKSTGPKSPEGRAACKNNAYKRGFRSRDMKELRALLRWQDGIVKKLVAEATGTEWQSREKRGSRL